MTNERAGREGTGRGGAGRARGAAGGVWALLGVLGACGGEPPPATPAAPSPSAEVVAPPPSATPADAGPARPPLAKLQQEALGAAAVALNAHDAAAFAALYADDAVIDVAGLNEVRGREAVRANMEEWFQAFDKVKLAWSRVFLKGDTVALEWVINGTHKGELFGVKGTEQAIGHYGLSILVFGEDGKVKTEHRYGDLGTVVAQIGAAPKAETRPVPPLPEKVQVFAAKAGDDAAPAREVARAFEEAVGARADAKVADLLADDAAVDGLFDAQTAKGKAKAKESLLALGRAFPDLTRTPSRELAVGDHVLVEVELRGTHKGALGKLKPTGRPVRLHAVDLVEVRDGKVVRLQTFQNSLEVLTELGLFAPDAASAAPKKK